MAQCAYEIESLNNETKRIIIEEDSFTEVVYPLTKKPNFSTTESFIETSRREPLHSFLPNFSLRDLLGFNRSTLYEE